MTMRPSPAVADHVDRRIERWVAAGLLDEPTAARIRAFERAAAGSRRWSWPVWLALGFGAVALAAGVLLFVSAQWDVLSPAARFTVVLAGVGALHVAGAAAAERWPALAVTLHAVGTASLGAGVYLAGQIFNLDEHWPGGLMLWAMGAAAGWALLAHWPQLLLLAALGPAWLVGEWVVAVGNAGPGDAAGVAAGGITLLALAYAAAPGSGARTLDRTMLAGLGVAVLPVALIVLALATDDGPGAAAHPLPGRLLGFGWATAIGVPLALGGVWRQRQAWPLAAAAVWIVVAVRIEPTVGETALYAWWAVGAAAMASWGVAEARISHINLGAAIFVATVLTFYFSRVMDKLDRAAGLMALGVVLLAGGWLVERSRRRLVARARRAEGGPE